MSKEEQQIHKALSLLGMARRAGVALIGQDQVFGALHKRLCIVVASDCSPNVLRKITPALLNEACVCYRLEGVSREELGRPLGVQSAQIVALPTKNGFAGKLAELLQQGGVHVYEQNEGI